MNPLSDYFNSDIDILHCRLCRHVLNIEDSVMVGPFPKAAQYFPEQEDFGIDHGVTLKLVTCTDCQLTQLTNGPVSYFREVITAANNSPSICSHRLALFRRIREQLPYNKTARALEIGCGSGSNLSLLRSAGFESIGIEYSPHQNSFDQPNLGIFNSYLLEFNASSEARYDLIVSFNYLEHQPDTLSFLNKCHDILHDDGKLLLTVPNLDHLLASQSAHEFVTDHLVYFSPLSITNSLHRTGFTVEELSIINNRYDIQVVAHKSCINTIASCKESLESLVSQLNTRLSDLALKGLKVAVWGAGHRTLALISLCNHSLISCILDSATFKQNRFTPLSHLKIMSPDILSNPACDIDIILVMLPGVYPSEVIRHIKSLPIHYEAEQFPPGLI